MKSLLVLRHAKAEIGSPDGEDISRPLTERGWRQARAIGGWMAAQAIRPDLVLVSPAVRLAETLTGLGDGLGEPLSTRVEEAIYLARFETIVALVRAADDAADCLMVAGHNPAMPQTVLALARAGTLRDKVEHRYPTGSLAELRLDIDRWEDLRSGAATLARFIRPRDLLSAD